MSGLFGVGANEGIDGRGRSKVKRSIAEHERWADAIMPGEVGAGAIETELNRRPLAGLALILAVLLGILCLRLFDLQIVNGQRNLGLAEGNRIRGRVIRAPRGVIYDRNKEALVRNQASYDVTVIPQLLPRNPEERQAIYARLNQLIGVPLEEIIDKAEKDGLPKNLPQLVVSNLDREKALLLDQSSTGLPGFSLDVNPVRETLIGSLMSHLLGYTSRISPAELSKMKGYLPTDYIGKLGIERQYEDILSGQSGSEQTEVDAEGRTIKILASKPAVAGSDLVLTIDRDLQSKLSEAISRQMNASGSRRGSGVALNPKTGEVLALVSLPGYDNNLFSRGISHTDFNHLNQDPAQPLFNKAIAGAYPTGSIIKPLVALAALQEKVVSTSTTVNDTGALEITHQYDANIKYTFRSYDPGGLGLVNVTKAIMQSSNIFFYTIGGGFGNIKGLGVDRLAAYYQKFGLGNATGIDLPDETKGRVPTPEWKQRVKKEAWFTGDTYNMAVGQGDTLASPLQMAVATAAVANGGTVYKPYLLKQVLDGQNGVAKETKPEVVREAFIAPAHINTVREAMRAVVMQGTACCLIEKEVKVPVAGKTGTAETDPTGKRKAHAWFSAFAPYNDPSIVVVVLIENSGEGSQFAAPAVRETLAWHFNR
jgi:penicillin-binding protein 2